jgi:Activator of Hsp90 ATPase homolog 1-like protein
LVRVRFLPHADGTEILLSHERFAEEAIRDMHLSGWNGCLDKLEQMFALVRTAGKSH